MQPDFTKLKPVNQPNFATLKPVISPVVEKPFTLPGQETAQAVATGIGKGIVSTVGSLTSIGKNITTGIGGMVGFKEAVDTRPILNKIKEVSTPEGTAENIGFATEKIAEFLAPSSIISKAKAVATGAIKGTSILSKLARLGTKSAIEGTAVTGQSALQEGEINDNVKTAGIIATLFPVAGTVLKTAGVGVQKVGQKIQQSVIKPSIADVKDGFKVETLQKYNLGGSLEQTLAKTNAKMNEIATTLKEKLKDSIIPVDLNTVYANTEKRMLENKIANFGDVGAVQRILGSLRQEVSEVGGQNGLVNLLDANIIKRGAGTKGSWVFGNADPDARAVEKVYNTFYNEIKVAIEKAAEKSGHSEIKGLNKQLSELIPISNSVLRRIPIAERNNALSLTDVISITGSFIDPRALLLTGINKLSKMPQVGNLLAKAGESLKNPKVKSEVIKRLLGN